MNSHLISDFEELLETFLVDSEKPDMYFRANPRNPNILQEEFLDFANADGSEIYKSINWLMNQNEAVYREFMDSLLPDFFSEDVPVQGSKLAFDPRNLVNSLCPEIAAEDLELLVSSFSIDGCKEVLVSSIVGKYIKFKGTGVPDRKMIGFAREDYVSVRYYHISRFKKITNTQNPEQNTMKMLEDAAAGKLNFEHKFTSAGLFEKKFFKDEKVFHKTSRKRFRVESEGVFKISDTKFVTVKEIDELGILGKDVKSFSPDALVTSPSEEISNNVKIYCGDDVRLTAGAVDEVMVGMGWQRGIISGTIGKLNEEQAKELKAYFFYRNILCVWTFEVVDFYNSWVQIKPIVDVRYPSLLTNLKLDGILINTRAKNLDLAPTADNYQARTSIIPSTSQVPAKVITSGTGYLTDYQKKKREEEEMSKKKKREEEAERLRLEEEDKKFGFVDLSHYADKLVVVSAPQGNVLNYLDGKKGKVDEYDSSLGRLIVEFAEKKVWFRASQGHLENIKILSGLVVSSEEHPDLV